MRTHLLCSADKPPLMTNRSIAQDLRLDEPPPADLSEREKLNRLRTWFEVLTVSSFDAIRAGRPAPCPRNNFTSRMSASWYRCSALNSPFDFYTSAYADLLLFVSSMWGPMGPTGIDSRVRCLSLAVANRE